MLGRSKRMNKTPILTEMASEFIFVVIIFSRHLRRMAQRFMIRNAPRVTKPPSTICPGSPKKIRQPPVTTPAAATKNEQTDGEERLIRLLSWFRSFAFAVPHPRRYAASRARLAFSLGEATQAGLFPLLVVEAPRRGTVSIFRPRRGIPRLHTQPVQRNSHPPSCPLRQCPSVFDYRLAS